MDADVMMKWLQAMLSAMGHGGRATAARTLGLSPSGLSKLTNTAGRSFDEKTAKCAAWISQSKTERYSEAEFPITETREFEGLLIDTREMPDGRKFYTWRAAT